MMTKASQKSRHMIPLASLLLLFASLLTVSLALVLPSGSNVGNESSWPINEYGQTYGVPREIPLGGVSAQEYLEELCPDLVEVWASDTHVVGYAYKEDVYSHQLYNIIELQDFSEAGGFDRSIPVYESDGRTVIGNMRPGNETE